jgi:hypothetical protein
MSILYIGLIVLAVYFLWNGFNQEGFATAGAPQSMPSPNLFQAYQFRLGARERVDAAMQMAK